MNSKYMPKEKKLQKWSGFNFWNVQTYEKPPREGTDQSDEANEFFRNVKSFLKKELGAYGVEMKWTKGYYDAYITASYGGKTCKIIIGDIRTGYEDPLGHVLYRDGDRGNNRFTDIDSLPKAVAVLLGAADGTAPHLMRGCI